MWVAAVTMKDFQKGLIGEALIMVGEQEDEMSALWLTVSEKVAKGHLSMLLKINPTSVLCVSNITSILITLMIN